GMKVNQQSMDAKNAAAVIITADLPPFTSPGDQINVTVSTMGDAGSLKGGVLIQTPLRGADGRIYAVAQGALSVGGSTAGNHLNVAKIPRGATVEREVPMNFVNNHTIYYLLRNKDFTTANRMADAINETFGPGAARAQDAGKIEVHIPYSFQDNPVEFISQIDHISILVDQEARVVINERTGTVVFGGTVKISPVAISHKSMAIKVGNELNPINEESHVVNLDKGSTVEELIKTLNLMGVKTEDLIAIIQEIRNAGALQANLEIM
ncbi:flagellar basal body P-ring protein FlgI, partial [bacterium]|nr:flagellar basal body P-ring protein FlgI [bacterium]